MVPFSVFGSGCTRRLHTRGDAKAGVNADR